MVRKSVKNTLILTLFLIFVAAIVHWSTISFGNENKKNCKITRDASIPAYGYIFSFFSLFLGSGVLQLFDFLLTVLFIYSIGEVNYHTSNSLAVIMMNASLIFGTLANIFYLYFISAIIVNYKEKRIRNRIVIAAIIIICLILSPIKAYYDFTCALVS